MAIADFAGAQEQGARFGGGDDGRALHALAEIGELIESGRFSLPVAQTFALAEIAEAHRTGEEGRARGKIVLGGRLIQSASTTTYRSGMTTSLITWANRGLRLRRSRVSLWPPAMRSESARATRNAADRAADTVAPDSFSST